MSSPRRFFRTIARSLLLSGILCAFASAHGALAQGRHHTVVIESMQFSPKVLEIKRGDTVEWINKDFFPHNATADDRRFVSEEIAPEKSWRWQAETKGTIPYLCTLHPTMKGMLVVK